MDFDFPFALQILENETQLTKGDIFAHGLFGGTQSMILATFKVVGDAGGFAGIDYAVKFYVAGAHKIGVQANSFGDNG